MKSDQSQFESANVELSTLVQSFDRYSDESNYEEIATQAKNIMNRLKQTEEKAKKFNMHEGLTGEEETNYELVRTIVQDFTPFFELWTTIE